MIVKNVEQRSKEWFKMRLGVITGSRCKNVFKSNNLTFVDELIAERLSGEVYESPTTDAMRWGMMMESVALEEYRMRKNLDAREIGFCVHDEYDWLAISPDALVYDNDVPIGGVEIKCPSTKKHVEYLRQGKIPSEYKSQIMHYFIVIDSIEWMDFVSYDPRIQKNLFIFRITRDEMIDDIDSRKQSYHKFWEKLLKYEEQIIG